MTPGPAQPLATYEPFFGFSESPFSLAPDPRFLFASASHSAALAQVAHALERREPLVVITGDIGTGKTLLCRTVLQRLPFKTFLSVIHDPLLDSDDLLKEMLKDFGVIAKDPARFGGATRHQLVETLHAFLTSLAPIQAHAVVMIDEAQHLRPDVLEQIRLLSNIDDEKGTILQIILVGQTDLEPLLSRPELRQLHQRVSRRFALEPLNTEEVQQYIEHRLALARQDTPSPLAGPGATFTPDAIRVVTQISSGVPRVINLLCDRSLEQAFMAQVRTIDGAIVHSAAAALGIEGPAGSSQPRGVAPPRAQPAPETVADIVQRADEAETPAVLRRASRVRPAARSTRTPMLAALASAGRCCRAVRHAVGPDAGRRGAFVRDTAAGRPAARRATRARRTSRRPRPRKRPPSKEAGRSRSGSAEAGRRACASGCDRHAVSTSSWRRSGPKRARRLSPTR